MEHLGVIGLNWRTAGAEGLARFTVAREDEAERVGRLARDLGVDELVYVATCNRVELYFRVEDPGDMGGMRSRAFASLTGATPEPGEAERTFRAWADEGAAEHIFLVAAGLDSAKVGETEINGQLKRALDLALEVGTLPNRGSQLEALVAEALKLSRRLRRDRHLDEGHMSLAEIALESVRARLANVTDLENPVLLVGASPMNERCATSLAAEGVGFTIANRTKSKAEDFARHFQACSKGLALNAMSLDELRATPPAVEVIITATAANEPVIDRALLARLADLTPSGNMPLVIDFGVPPDVAPADCERLGIERISMQNIIEAAEATRERRLAEAAEAREEIDAALERLRLRLGDEHVAPFVSALQRRYRTIAKQGAEHLLNKRLTGLDEAGREAVFSFAEKLAGRFAHLPSTGLFGVARVGGPAAVDAFLARADKELAKEFERAAHEAHLPPRPDSKS